MRTAQDHQRFLAGTFTVLIAGFFTIVTGCCFLRAASYGLGFAMFFS
jgi:hypothetical protein